MRTVIVGGGFAGVKAALELSKRKLGRITLISDEPYFLHHATLYATATGRDTSESVVPLKDIFATHSDVDVELDTMHSIDPDRKIVFGDSKEYEYDNLIIAIGAVTTYFDIAGMAKHSFGIKTLDDVRAFQAHLHREILINHHLDKNYVVIGGGTTGVELAGALSSYLREIAKSHHVSPDTITITLVESASRILPKLSVTASNKVRRKLEKQGVKILADHHVQALGADSVVIDGKKIPTKTAIWTCGSANNPFFDQYTDYFHLADNGRVEVNQYLEAYPHIYVLGDNAATPQAGTAWTALHDARFIADHLTRVATKAKLKPYTAKRSIVNVPIGDGWAYIEMYGIYAAGRVGFMIRRLLTLSGYKALLSPNQAMQAWQAHYHRDEACDLCKVPIE